MDPGPPDDRDAAPADARPPPGAGASAGAQEDELLLRFARAAHAAGFPSDELERRVEEIGLGIGREVSVSATPTLVEIAVGRFPSQRTSTLRVQPHDPDLDTIARLDDLAARVTSGAASPAAAIAELEGLRPARRHPLLLFGTFAAAGAAVTAVLGGGWREMATALLAGAAVGAVAPLARREAARAIVAPAAAILASIVCAAVAQIGLRNAVELSTLGALVAMLPGLTLTIGIRELATGHLQSGVANTALSVVQLLGLVFGVAVGTSIARNWFGTGPVVTASALGLPVELVAAAAAGAALTVTLNAGVRDAGWGAAAAVLALAARSAAEPLIGGEAAVFAAALAVGLAGNLFGRVRRRSPLVFIVPGILLLVPGSLGFDSASRLLSGDTVAGVAVGFDALVIALAIVYGLIVSAALLPDRARAAIRPGGSSPG